MAVEHKITLARHPNGRDQVMECSCGVRVPVRSRTDYLNQERVHLEAVKILEAENEGGRE